MRFLPATLVLLCLLSACGGNDVVPTPKPRAYPRVFYPEKAYQSFSESSCPFSFEFPVYSQINRDTAFFDEAPAHPCWFDIFTPVFDNRIHFSYYQVGREKSLERLRQDAFEMADWHNKRANYIDEVSIRYPEKKVYGFAFLMEGPSASSVQFYLTDSTRHFVRGALYFNTQAQPDSLAPVVKFVRQDIDHLIETFQWTE